MIDLHSHTTASDGELSPPELVALAARSGVTHLAVTDHDTVAALGEARVAARASGLELVAGIEISAFLHGRREVHVLGHFVDDQNPELASFAVRLREDRRGRMQEMVEKVQRLGFPVSFEQVLAIANGANLGRPHLALWFVDRGYCTSPKEAFDRFLGEGRPAFVDRDRLDAKEAIALVRRAGGTATLAHPGSSRMERGDIVALADAGLSGLEAHHGDHSPSQREKFLAIARDLDLVPTGGSDYHGPRLTPDRTPGCAPTPPGSYERLRARAELL